jgi:serine/threonine protein kinase
VTIASHIGQYRILRKLGAGGMGLVFLGEHTLLGRRAAIKTLLPTMSANREIVERFFNEARATSAIADPGIIQVFDFGYHVDGTAYIVMELLEGESLSARIERLGKLSPGDALRIARQIAGSLAAAHACDIVHRDLKPENIFLVADAEAQGGERTKILDFGICKMGTGDPTLTESGAMIGTPVYMSPEQCRGLGGIDHRSDIYAFGCLMFHMLTGRPPFVGEASGELIVAHLEEDPPAPSVYVAELPFAVDALLLRCLAKAPEDRYQSMTELQHELGELAAGLANSEPTVAAVPPSMPLGRGFRSLYDGNFAITGHEPWGTNRRPPWLRFMPTPRTPPEPEPEPEELDDSVAVPSRRATIRAVLACVLVVGVVIGLVTTSFILYNDSSAEAGGRRRIAIPVADDLGSTARSRNVTAAGAPVLGNAGDSTESSASGGATLGAAGGPDEPDAVVEVIAERAARPASIVSSGASSGASSVERSRRQHDAARDMNTAAKPRPRPIIPADRPAPSPRTVSSTVSAPATVAPQPATAAARTPAMVASPTTVAPAPATVSPAATAAPTAVSRTPATVVPPPAAPPARSNPGSAPPSPPAEDLYDTR